MKGKSVNLRGGRDEWRKSGEATLSRKIITIGNSSGVTIPVEMMKSLKLHKGRIVSVTIRTRV